jgi:hypothetical protein
MLEIPIPNFDVLHGFQLALLNSNPVGARSQADLSRRLLRPSAVVDGDGGPFRLSLQHQYASSGRQREDGQLDRAVLHFDRPGDGPVSLEVERDRVIAHARLQDTGRNARGPR